MHIISLYDFSGLAVRDWSLAGHDCFCYDKKHSRIPRIEGNISYLNADLWSAEGRAAVLNNHRGHECLIIAFPVCTDLAGSGSRHWESKRNADPFFQITAIERATWAAKLSEELGGAPYMIENPKGALSTQWRKPTFYFDPRDFGGYLPEDDVHPAWPQYFPPRDAYTKRTGAWLGGGMVTPTMKPVPLAHPVGESPIFKKLGGKSDRTKEIRSTSPRGFFRALYEANK